MPDPTPTPDCPACLSQTVDGAILDALPTGSKVADCTDTTWTKINGGWWLSDDEADEGDAGGEDKTVPLAYAPLTITRHAEDHHA